MGVWFVDLGSAISCKDCRVVFNERHSRFSICFLKSLLKEIMSLLMVIKLGISEVFLSSRRELILSTYLCFCMITTPLLLLAGENDKVRFLGLV